jgi:UDP-glucuronate 4-epimerase
MPFSEHDSANHPLSIYAASKKSNELMAHAYSYLYQLPTTGLRFFTVYGPNGRPDMSIYKFVKNLFNNKKINVFNGGKHSRDYTYIDDIIDAIFQLLKLKKNKFENYQVFNIAKGKSETLIKKITIIEKITGKKFKKKFLRKQDGDIIKTHADITKLKKLINYNPKIKLELGLTKFINWYKQNSNFDY